MARFETRDRAISRTHGTSEFDDEYLGARWLNPTLLAMGYSRERAEWFPGGATSTALLLGSAILGPSRMNWSGGGDGGCQKRC